MKTTAKVYGASEAVALLADRTPREAHNLLRSTVHGMAGELRDDMRRDAPKNTGGLRKAIRTKRERTQKRGQAISNVTIDRANFYWRFLEYGTSKMRAASFIGPAVERFMAGAHAAYLRQFGKKLEAAIARAGRRAGRGR